MAEKNVSLANCNMTPNVLFVQQFFRIVKELFKNKAQHKNN